MTSAENFLRNKLKSLAQSNVPVLPLTCFCEATGRAKSAIELFDVKFDLDLFLQTATVIG